MAARIVRRFASTAPKTPLFGLTKYGGRRTVTLIPGDGIGPEITTAVRELFEWMKVPVDFEVIDFHGADPDAEKRMDDAITSLRRNGVGLKGILSTPQGRATRTSLNIKLRTELDLFANVIFCKTPAGLPTRHDDVDIVVVRQNTEAEYSGLEHEISPGVIESLKVISREESMRIAKYAFDYAAKTGRSKVTAVHKANIMKQGDGLFLQCCKEVASLYPNIVFEAMIVDNTSMQLVSRPQQFDVVVTPNLYGNIVGNIGAGLVGGAGLVPGYNIGNDIAVFEPGARQIQQSLTGKGVANPVCMISSGAMMLRHLGMDTFASPIEKAVRSVLTRGDVRTPDMGGDHTTADMSRAIIDEVDAILTGAEASA
ncbi:isocitrate dehydrogenase subunit gamma [Salpingoeca rosetta]|uniref:Isocitrate dehydrogenase subunit gamma n=1 Tax=Salpingoeca rosetta (strain ATCC 50818 / BSB-021) TaxID=946362 RepID=F2UH70_SALR5|nr:isocitrate dehydrogenase subunit gamma [Salpingoeca rosetta]XP_012493091.1 isocitrate dehydrogenase subunit gamma, variant [Salpingoeca rosetta]EGD76469.1 isocitrate dehydrogenase subunit gamma, variant [Salpingoeca rosetta]EGD76470.1 isocitrate dehydrogenase subunit gamma [Salpingoeca rosetta]|eukprot:XP_004991384.1 isocitrate dehydrogenase subunit gamma [Salpingoeca rosetta]